MKRVSQQSKRSIMGCLIPEWGSMLVEVNSSTVLLVELMIYYP